MQGKRVGHALCPFFYAVEGRGNNDDHVEGWKTTSRGGYVADHRVGRQTSQKWQVDEGEGIGGCDKPYVITSGLSQGDEILDGTSGEGGTDYHSQV